MLYHFEIIKLILVKWYNFDGENWPKLPKLKNEIEIWTRSIYNCDYKNGDDIDKNSEIKSRILDET